MSEDEARREQDEGAEVEAHKRLITATDEPVDELRRESDEDVEAHLRARQNEEPIDEMRRENDEDDDVEAHKKPTGMV